MSKISVIVLAMINIMAQQSIVGVFAARAMIFLLLTTIVKSLITMQIKIKVNQVRCRKSSYHFD